MRSGNRAPTRARAPPGLASRRAPWRFVGGHAASARIGGFRCPGVSPHASEERASGRAGAELPMWGGPLGHWLASPRPAPSSPGQTASPPPSGSHVRSAGASMRQAVARPSVLSGCVLRLGRRRATRRPQPARFPWDGCPCGKIERHLQVTQRPPLASRPGPVSTQRRTGARIRTPHGRPPARAWLRQRAELVPWPPPEALPPCALRADPMRLPHTICSGTMRACENGGPPPLPFSGGEERPPPLPKWEGRREASSSSPPVFGRGGASGAQAGGPRPRPGSRLGAAHLRTGGEEECTRTADTNPGCNYLVRGYRPSMHYFWRGDMPHFSSPLLFQRGARGCRTATVPRPHGGRAVDLGRPERGGCGRGRRRSSDPRGRRGRARPPFRQGWHPWPAPGS